MKAVTQQICNYTFNKAYRFVGTESERHTLVAISIYSYAMPERPEYTHAECNQEHS